MKLYSYFRSSTSYRVRIALNLKEIDYELEPINLLKDEQRSEDYLRINPIGGVPALQDAGHTLTQSLAILEYLEERYPTPPLLPQAPAERARVRALANVVACDMHGINNLRVLKYLTGELGLSEEQKTAWMHHWLHQGFSALETMLRDNEQTENFCHGHSPTLADICLVPQVFNAKRFELDMAAYPTIERIYAHCETLPAFAEAHPAKQRDAA